MCVRSQSALRPPQRGGFFIYLSLISQWKLLQTALAIPYQIYQKNQNLMGNLIIALKVFENNQGQVSLKSELLRNLNVVIVLLGLKEAQLAELQQFTSQHCVIENPASFA